MDSGCCLLSLLLAVLYFFLTQVCFYHWVGFLLCFPCWSLPEYIFGVHPDSFSNFHLQILCCFCCFWNILVLLILLWLSFSNILSVSWCLCILLLFWKAESFNAQHTLKSTLHATCILNKLHLLLLSTGNRLWNFPDLVFIRNFNLQK